MSEKDLESRVEKIEAYIERCEKVKEQERKTNLDKKFESLENHLVQQDKKQLIFATLAFGFAILLVGITLAFQKLAQMYQNPISPYIDIIFLTLLGLVVVFGSLHQLKKAK